MVDKVVLWQILILAGSLVARYHFTSAVLLSLIIGLAQAHHMKYHGPEVTYIL